MSILGNRVQRREDPALLTGGGRFVNDDELPDAAVVRYITSPVAHAVIEAIDIDDAQAAPGVLAVVTGADLGLTDQGPVNPMLPATMPRPLLARDRVRYVGEPVVAVVAETTAQAEDAAELVIVGYDDLDPVVDTETARLDEIVVHDEAGTNVAFQLELGDEPAFADCEVVVRREIVNPRVAPAPVEPHVAAAWWDDDRLVVRAASQGVHPVRDLLAEVYDLSPDRVRVIGADVGGGFGAKARPPAEVIVLGELARRVGRPVRWFPDRSADMVTMGHGRAQHQYVEIGGRHDGRITAYRLTVRQDAGAYPAMGALLPYMTRMMLTGCYDVTDVAYRSDSVITNTTPVGAYRGAGRPEAAAAIERAVDLFAAEVGLDPAEVRRTNLLRPEAFPYQAPSGVTYDVGDYGAALDLVLDAAGYDELRAEQTRRRDDGDRLLLGVGLASYVEITALGGGGEHGSIELLDDGRFRILTGSSPYGQGHHTTWAMLAAERLGVPIDQIEVVHGDTDVVPTGGITGGSRSVQIAGSAVVDATTKLVELARQQAAAGLEAAVDDVVLDTTTGRFHVAGTPSVWVGWDRLAARVEVPLSAESDWSAEGPTFPFGAHVAVVEVDVDTGGVRLRRLVAVDDAGTIINPLIADGQVHGGLAQGAAQALYEEFRYDDDGNPITANLADYAAISAAELPFFERIPMETPTPMNVLGAKGIGESGTIGATPAVQNAVVDALAHLGVRHIDMPCTPERVWRAMRTASG